MQMSIIEVFICRRLHMNTSMIPVCIWLICRLCTALHTKCCGAVNCAAKRQRYQEDLEENRAAKRQKYEDNSAAIKASERNRYWNDPAVRLAKRAAERKRYRSGHRTTTTTQRYVMACCIALALKSYRKMCMQHVYSTHVRDLPFTSHVKHAW